MIRPAPSTGLLTGSEVSATADWIVGCQEPDGGIPWEPGRHADPWNHLEAVIGLDLAGRTREAAAGIRWLLERQAADGSWAASWRAGRPEDAMVDANFNAYLAAAVLCHELGDPDDGLAAEAWPAVERALDWTLALQAPGGEVYWARDAQGIAYPAALVTSSSCIHLSIRCALALGELLGESKPGWRDAAARLAEAVSCRPWAFERKDRFAMDWYYPILAGVLDERAARSRLARRWSTFVAEGYGVRCVADRPWATAAETSELCITLAMLGSYGEGAQLFEWTRRFRCPDGSYWTGATFPEHQFWPDERTTWTAGAVLMANAALVGDPRLGLMFRLADPLEDPEAPDGLPVAEPA